MIDHITAVPLGNTYRFINHGQTVLVTFDNRRSAVGNKRSAIEK